MVCVWKYLVITSVIALSFTPKSCLCAYLNGFRIEMPDVENLAVSNSLGRVSIVGGRPVTLRLFTVHPLPAGSELSFATAHALPDTNCDDLRSTRIFSVLTMGDSVLSSTVNVNLPSDPAVYTFCLRVGNNVGWIHQGNSSWLQVEVSYLANTQSAPSALPLWAEIFLVVVFIGIAATCTAIAVSTLSLTRTDLKLLRSSGTSDERSYVKAVSPLRKRGNRVLSAVVFVEVVSCSTVAVLVEDMIQLTGAALAVSSASVLAFVVIIPLLISPHVGLSFATRSLWLANVIVVLTFPFSYPVGRLMDWILADDLPSVCDRGRVSSLQRAIQTSAAKEAEEEEMADRCGTGGATNAGILGLSEKCVKDLMTNIDNVFMIEFNTVLDENSLEQIASSGYTRIPVYENERTNVVAVLNVCDLAYVTAADCTSLKTVCFYNHPVNFVFEDMKLEVMLAEFKKGQSRMAFVQRVNDEGPGDPFYETLGMITFEDVIGDIFQSESSTEPPDIIMDNDEVKNLNRINKNNFARLPRVKKELTDQMSTVICHFLSTSVMQFGSLLMSEQVISRLLKQDVIINVNLADVNCRRTLYERGKPANYFTLIVEGHVQIHIGTEDFIFDGGPFMYFGAQALTGELVTSVLSNQQPSSVQQTGGGDSSHVYIPDYTVEAVTDLVMVHISADQYAAALHAASLEKHIRASDGPNHRTVQPQFRAEVSPSSAELSSRSQLLSSDDRLNGSCQLSGSSRTSSYNV